jgi:Lon protease-like protein
MSDFGSEEGIRLVRLFPLPNVVLFPGAVLPLHIFEERYKVMTRDALRGDKIVAMALLKPGWEKNYYSRPAIEPVICVGRIAAAEELADGKFNFLLQGTQRARIVREPKREQPYRLAEIEPLEETAILEIDLEDERRRLAAIFQRPDWSKSGLAVRFRDIISSGLTTAQVADLVAFNFLEDISLKQSLLAEVDVKLRVARIVDLLELIKPVPAAAATSGVDPSWN